MLNTPSRQDPALLSSMDPAQIARAVQHCPIPLDSALQVGHLALFAMKWSTQYKQFEQYKYYHPTFETSHQQLISDSRFNCVSLKSAPINIF